MWTMPPQYGIPNAFGMPYQQENFMPTGFSSSSTEVPRPCTTLENALIEWNSEGKKKGGFKWLHCWEVLKDNAKFNGASHTSRGGKKARIIDTGDHTSGSGQDVEPSGDVEDKYVCRPIGQKAAKAGKRKEKTTAGGSTGPNVGRLLAEIGEVKEIHLKKQNDLEKLVRIESYKAYREMLKEDTSTMTVEELQAHQGLLAVLKEELGLK
ncbi:Unknown protein [Striga hermonthica]|uniref:No apical meristem-associated C-terminal domain-containing protein n=1 Tax=Striga hermonthica TaxID=68872 RepID=A0A9N7N6I9_STRHE|nr:Unknown protein [Striga hermonthica]